MAKRTAGAHGRARPVGGADCARPDGHDVELGGKEHVVHPRGAIGAWTPCELSLQVCLDLLS